MKNLMRAAAVVVALGVGSMARAALVTFHVDPSQSTISLGPLINIGDTLLDDQNQAVAQEGGGSASYSGTFEADIVGDTINFLGGNRNIIASTSATLLEPGDAPGNYGMVTLDGEKTAALRGLQFTFTKNNTSEPFDVDASGHLRDPLQGDQEWSPFVDASWTLSRFGDFPDSGLLYNPMYPAILTQEGDEYRLEIPVEIVITWSETSAGDSQFLLEGTIVATSAIPEPGMMSTLAAAATLLPRRRRA